MAGKNYRNDENNATLTFKNDGIRQHAFIKLDDGGQSAVFDYIIHGGPASSTVIGIYW